LQGTPEQAVANAEKAKKEAETTAATAKATYDAKIRRQSPPEQYAIPIGDYLERLKGMARWWELPQYVRKDAETFAKGMPGVEVWTQFQVATPGPSPNAIPPNVVAFNLGPMAARGSFADVMNWARRWNKYHFTAAVDNLNVRLVDKGKVQG